MNNKPGPPATRSDIIVSGLAVSAKAEGKITTCKNGHQCIENGNLNGRFRQVYIVSKVRCVCCHASHPYRKGEEGLPHCVKENGGFYVFYFGHK